MEFKKSKYYDESLLGEAFYENIDEYDEILTVQEFFNMNSEKKEYENYKENEHFYELKVFNNYYELDCEAYSYLTYIVFDKPVHITGGHCFQIIAPEILIKSNKNSSTYHCVTNKLVIDNNYNYDYNINFSKIKDVFCYNQKVRFCDSQIDNFYIKNEKINFAIDSQFLDYHKIKIFGTSEHIKKKIAKSENFKEGTIYIE